MDEEKDLEEKQNEEQSKPVEKAGPSNGKEEFYENFSGVPLKYLDIFIGVCVAAFILLIVVGVLRGGKFL